MGNVDGEEARRTRIAGLDGLRALAVLLVFFFHLKWLNFGWIGVQIFFVLSGYLITGLLLKTRDAPLPDYLRCFFVRRAIRIFPLVFSYLALLLAIHYSGIIDGFRIDGIAHVATFTYNFYNALPGYWGNGFYNHLWSLSVEEQFYLFWPFLIYAVPRRRLPVLMAGIVILTPLIRYLLLVTNPFENTSAGRAVYVLTPSHFDAFAIGALAVFWRPTRRQLATLSALAVVAVLALANLRGIGGITDYGPVSPGFPLQRVWSSALHTVLGYSALNTLAACLVIALSRRLLLPNLFDSRPVRYIGTVSFGFYVYHNPVQELYVMALRSPVGYEVLNAIDALPLPVIFALLASVQFALVTLAATISYRFVETPFLRRKATWAPDPIPHSAPRQAIGPP